MAVTYAFTLDPQGRQRVGKQHVLSGLLTATGTYTTGGDAVTPASVGLGVIESLSIDSAFTNGTEAMVSRYLPTGLLQHFWGGGAISSELDEITAADTVTGFAARITVKGR